MTTQSELLQSAPTRPLRRSEYDSLVADGVFENEPIELLEGRLVLMSPQGSPHSYVVQKLTTALVRAVGLHAEVRVQCPLAISEVSEPEPDLAVVAPDLDVFADHPRTALLVVEVAASSVQRDARVKLPLYARAGLPEYWIVVVDEPGVLIHRDPHGERYREVSHVGRGSELTLDRLPQVSVSTDDFLPPA